MTRKEKLLKKFLERPESLKFKDLKRLLQFLGFRLASVRGSHRKFRNPNLEASITIPVHGRDCKNIYKRKLSKFIIELLNEK